MPDTSTDHHGFYHPDPDTGAFDPGGDMKLIAESFDTKMPKIHYGTDFPSPTLGRDGDLYFVHQAPPVVLTAPFDGEVSP